MAKNLKLNIKNAQLAQALNLNKLKKAKEDAVIKAAKDKKAREAKKLDDIAKAKAAELKKAAEPKPVTPKPVKAKQPEAKQPEAKVESPKEIPETTKNKAESKEKKPKVSAEDSKSTAKTDDKKAENSKEKTPGKPMQFRDFRDLKTQRKQQKVGSFDARDRQGLRETDESWRRKRKAKRGFGSRIEQEIIRPKNVSVRTPISIKDLASEMKLKASELIAKLFLQGMALTLNDYLDDETTIQLLGHEFDCEITIDTSEEERLRITDKTIKEEIAECDPKKLVTRPPVVTFMGHVDHGKTSLIDAIRKTKMAEAEAGAITQHIGAFKCHTSVGDLTILDTPGHEAFTAMRMRGADATDIIVLVVAGDEGIRQQTEEAIQQAQDANVPIVVAINKSDKPNFNADTIYRELADKELLPEIWGGSTITVNCSAVTGEGIPELLEMLALQSEILELKANPDSRARGTVLESQLHKGLGSVATILIQNGTLHIGNPLVLDLDYGRVKTMHDEHGRLLETAGPSTPVKITGLSALPEAGSEFIVVDTDREARILSKDRSEGRKRTLLQQSKRTAFESLVQQKQEEKKVLHLVLRADVQGSLEALKTSLMKIKSDKADVNILSSDVGEISESDIELAAASQATIIGFHTKIEAHAEELIKQTKANVRLHTIIYHAIDDVKELMRKTLDKIAEEKDIGKAEVLTTFKSSQLGVIAGCKVTEGLIKRGCQVRQIRKDEQIWKGVVPSLKRIKEDVKEVQKGYECGILLQNRSDIQEGDIFEAFEIIYKEQDL